jgi:hypothetical protein
MVATFSMMFLHGNRRSGSCARLPGAHTTTGKVVLRVVAATAAAVGYVAVMYIVPDARNVSVVRSDVAPLAL